MPLGRFEDLRHPQCFLPLLLKRFDAEEVGEDGIWLRLRMGRLHAGQRAGWKLHISSTPGHMAAMLEQALALIHESGLPFKILRDADSLERMNDGRFGLSQVGKAVTIYTRDEAQAAELGRSLCDALQAMPGPRIPADVPFAEDAPVYYRYGPYDGRYVLDAMGQKRRVLAHPEHGDVIDPTSGGDTAPPAPHLLPSTPAYDHLGFLRERFLILSMLHLSAKGGVFIGLEKGCEQARPLTIKTAKQGTNADLFGRDAIWALEHEHSLLTRLAGTPGLPEPGALIRNGDLEAAIVRPYIEGKTLWDLWTAPGARSVGGRAHLLRCLDALRETVKAIHAGDVILRDLSPGNVLVSGEGIHILDLELAHVQGDEAPPYRRGTRGFYDPALDRWRTPSPADDHYALAAMALMVGEGIHPAWFPQGIGGDPEKPSGEKEPVSSVRPISPIGPIRPILPPAIPERLLAQLAQDLRNRIATYAEAGGDPDASTVYSGVAGALILAVEWDPERVLAAIPERAYEATAKAFEACAGDVVRIPGLYFGASGLAMALGAVSATLGREALADRALAMLRSAEAADSGVPDLCQGVAGLAWASMTLHRLLDSDEALDVAIGAGKRLVAMAEEGEGGLLWPWPEGPYGTLSGARDYGFAHGAAGIVHALMALYGLCGERAFLASAEGGLRTLRAAAKPVPEEEAARYWPVSAKEPAARNAWCHGTPGAAKALAKALSIREDHADLSCAIAAAHGIAAANNPGYCLCHGVASRLDAYTDLLPILPENEAAPIRAEADRDTQLLLSLDLFALERAEATGEAGAESGGLMTGALGAMRALLRYLHLLDGPYGHLLQ